MATYNINLNINLPTDTDKDSQSNLQKREGIDVDPLGDPISQVTVDVDEESEADELGRKPVQTITVVVTENQGEDIRPLFIDFPSILKRPNIMFKKEKSAQDETVGFNTYKYTFKSNAKVPSETPSDIPVSCAISYYDANDKKQIRSTTLTIIEVKK